METSKAFKHFALNRTVSMSALLHMITGEYYEIDRTCYCPFHDNTETKAAKIYKNAQVELLFCFTEHRTYNVVAAIKLLTDWNEDAFFEKVWSKLSETKKK